MKRRAAGLLAQLSLGLALTFAAYGCGYRAAEYIKAEQLPKGSTKKYDVYSLTTISPGQYNDNLIALVFALGNKKLEFANPNDYKVERKTLSLDDREARRGLQEPREYNWVVLKSKEATVVGYALVRNTNTIILGKENGTLEVFVHGSTGPIGGGGGGGGGGGDESGGDV